MRKEFQKGKKVNFNKSMKSVYKKKERKVNHFISV